MRSNFRKKLFSCAQDKITLCCCCVAAVVVAAAVADVIGLLKLLNQLQNYKYSNAKASNKAKLSPNLLKCLSVFVKKKQS